MKKRVQLLSAVYFEMPRLCTAPNRWDYKKAKLDNRYSPPNNAGNPGHKKRGISSQPLYVQIVVTQFKATFRSDNALFLTLHTFLLIHSRTELAS